MNRRDHGRALLQQWDSGKPGNFYEDDAYLRAALARHVDRARLARYDEALRQAGADSAGPIDRAASVLDRPEHLPRVESWNRVGERTDDIVFHPLHHEIGRRVWRSGILSALAEPGHVTLHAALTYLFGLNGEAPHLCSVACTAGLIKTIQRAGSDFMRRDWLPRLLETDYERRWHAAQFVTEVQGGSDVGANACMARPEPGAPGRWRLSGEKWFCSNVSADLYAVSARPEGAREGTAGVALFVVPRRLENSRPNGVMIRRLKNKLGTRTLPTAEIDFDKALAWQLGELHEGFRLLVGIVINTSRLHVAIGTSAMMRRAWVEAHRYACLREAFGRKLADFPAVRAQLAEMRVLGTAGLSLTLFAAAAEDRLLLAGSRPEDDALFRSAVNLAKFVCSVDAGRVVHHAIEILGGNGTIEDFSPLPRLWREVPVQESWEGPHNTLVAQILRDAQRAKLHEPLLTEVESLLLAVRRPELAATRERALGALDDLRGSLTALLRRGPDGAALHMRRLVTRMARLTQVSLLLQDAQAQDGLGPWLGAAADLLLRRFALPAWDPLADPEYEALVATVTEA